MSSPSTAPSPTAPVLRVAVIPGDGIGPEVSRVGVAILEAVCKLNAVPVECIWFDLGAERYLRDGTTLPDDLFATLRDDFTAIYLGALGDPRVPDHRHAKEILLGLRTRLDLYINFRPISLWHPDHSPLKAKTADDLDFVIFRENTEGLYAGVGGHLKKGTPDEVAITEMISTRKGVERIVRAAFEYAAQHGKRRVCMSDKSNAIPHAHGLWGRVFAEVRAEYPQIEARHLYADVAAMEFVRAPEDFDVLVTSNLLGDVLSDLAAQLVGGLGLATSANLHPGRPGLFEPVHGSAPTLAGTQRANPLAMVLTGAQLLRFSGYEALAQQVEAAVRAVVLAGQTTPDLGGTLSTDACGQAVFDALHRLAKAG